MIDPLEILGRSLGDTGLHALLDKLGDIEAETLDLAPDENLPPEYYLTSRTHGLQMRHSAAGRIEAISLFILPSDDISAYVGLIVAGLTGTSLREQVLDAMGKPDFEAAPRTLPILGRRGWIYRFDREPFSFHFEFSADDGRLARVTLMTLDSIGK
jgi:hypothetical protein